MLTTFGKTVEMHAANESVFPPFRTETR
jgi:hypothetical protein